MLIFIICYFAYVIYRSMEAMHMLQQNLYNENNRYLKWCFKNLDRVFNFIDFIPLILLPLMVYIPTLDQFKDVDNIFKNSHDIILVISSLFYLIGILVEYSKNKNNQNKLPLKGTKRVKRLFILFLIIYIIPFIVNIYKFNNIETDIFNRMLVYGLSGLMALFIYYVVYLVEVLNTPINKLEYHYYYKKAKNKLKSYNNLMVVGVTGSYGKTSSKNILTEILNTKYITRVSPKNYNTPYGLMMTINNYMDKFDEILVAEMGAYRVGRIKNLCNFVKPKYGILTCIGEAHLETFGSRENIQKTKFELIESLPKDGLGVLNMDDPYQVSYQIKNDCPIRWVSIGNSKADIYATDIKCDSSGMSFKIHYGKQEELIKTRLLGNHNVYNILQAICLGLYLNIDIEDIKSACLQLKNTEHRLELKKMGSIYQLDDAYNSNPVGAKSALDVLKLMNGTKVVVTPGMVELGKNEYDDNYNFGKQISEVSDYVILVGEKRTKAIYNGLIDNKFNKDNIFVINKVVDSFNICNALKEENKDLFALYENDLPDIYTEKENNYEN